MLMLIIFFIFGLIIGSFLNVVVYRLELAESILGRSRCPHCKSKIHWYDNIPLLSFILLQARCRDCKGKISWQYPLVEFMTGIVFLLTAKYFFVPYLALSWLETFFYLGVFSMLEVIFVYDCKLMEIPMIVLWAAIGWTLLGFLFLDWSNFNLVTSALSLKIFSGILGGSVAFLFFFILASVSKEKWMGLGDAYLGFLIGFLVGWPYVLLALMMAFTIGAFFGIIVILLKKKTMKSRIPFAPFLVIGALITIFFCRIFPQFGSFLFYF